MRLDMQWTRFEDGIINELDIELSKLEGAKASFRVRPISPQPFAFPLPGIGEPH
jgi:hypothetical protein